MLLRGEAPFLPECDTIIGHLEIRDDDLKVNARSAIYIPRISEEDWVVRDTEWGLYDLAGRNVVEGAYNQGPPGPPRLGQSDTTAVRAEDIETAPDRQYLYAGVMMLHYGHFLLTSVARLWPVLARGSHIKILYHGQVDPEGLFSVPYVADIFGALGLKCSDFVRFTSPTLIPDLLIPQSSFQETTYAHLLHAKLCRTIGQHLIGSPSAIRCSRPVYLSKCRLAAGVWNIVNEDRMMDRLERAGVDIQFPEMLSLEQQVRIFEQRPVIGSVAGSALHTTLFTDVPNCIVGLNRERQLLSNQLLIDKLKNNRSTYVYPAGGMENLGSNEFFHSQFRLPDPCATAEAFLRHLDAAYQDQ